MAYAKTSLRAEKRVLREKMRAMGLGYREIAAEFARRYNVRPRAAWREAYGWSLQETAGKINEFRGHVGLDPGGFAGMTASHLCEHENWPGHGPRPAGRRPTPYLLALLAAVYDCGVAELIDLADREHLRPSDLLILDKYSQPGAQPSRPNRQVPGQAACALSQGAWDDNAMLPSASRALVPGGEEGPPSAAGADPSDMSRRQMLVDVGGFGAGAVLPLETSASPAVAGWAGALCDAVVDPVRAAQEVAACSQPGRYLEDLADLLRDLQREARAVTTASLMSDYAPLGKVLPGLIGRAELGHATADGDSVSLEPVLSDLYAVAAWTLIKADCPAVAWMAATRAVHAAVAAGDGLRSAAATRCLAEVHMRAGNCADAARLAFLATAHLDAATADKNAVLCLRGAAMLSAAAAAARRGDSYEAYTALKAARAYATEMGNDRVVLGTMFGPANVVIHNVAIPVELGRPGEAVRSIPSGLLRIPTGLAERKARFLIDVARSHAGTGDARGAEDALAQAEQASPDEVRHHRLTRQLVSELLPRSHRSSKIRSLAERCAASA